MTHYFNIHMKVKQFRPRELILQKVAVSQPTKYGKLSPNWKRPYHITEVVWPDAYQLEQLNSTPIARTWNSNNLRPYYQ